jgi:arsenite-transporting ATPase
VGREPIAHHAGGAAPRCRVTSSCCCPFDTVGLPALRALLARKRRAPAKPSSAETASPSRRAARARWRRAGAPGHGLVMVMGKGGVGKTTIAAALAVALARAARVHLTTTDPSRAPRRDARRRGARARRWPHRPRGRDAALHRQDHGHTRPRNSMRQGSALLLEDLRSPCTEEVAVFHAFSRVISEARSAFVVLDTAPTGHSLLLMDATGAYHRQTMRSLGARHRPSAHHHAADAPAETRRSRASSSSRCPRPRRSVAGRRAPGGPAARAHIEPWAWVINKSVAATGTSDPLLQARLVGERRQTARIADGLARRTARGRAGAGRSDGGVRPGIAGLTRRVVLVAWPCARVCCSRLSSFMPIPASICHALAGCIALALFVSCGGGEACLACGEPMPQGGARQPRARRGLGRRRQFAADGRVVRA